MASKLLTKSRYLSGLQCYKYLWISVHDPARLPDYNAATLHRFDQGKQVGELAKKLYPDGINIPTEDFFGNIRRTMELVRQRRPLFEGAVRTGRIYSRADILNPIGDDQWDIIEVKSGTSVKDIDIHDVSFQKHCFEQSGLKIRKVWLMHLDNTYVRNGSIAPESLFKKEDITETVAEAAAGIQERITAMLTVLDSGCCPEVEIGRYCSNPYECQMRGSCWEFLPDNCIFELASGGRACFDLFKQGVLTIKDIPADFALTQKQQIQHRSVTEGGYFINSGEIEQFLNSLHYPVHYLDFETFSPAIPFFNGTRPYQKIPFQFSLHVVKKDGAKPSHYGFLAEGPQDPRPQFLEALHRFLQPSGSIVVYNRWFEKSIVEELGNNFPDYRPWTEDVVERMVDLHVPFKNFHFYHPSQKGSTSLKKVLPAVTGRGYDGLVIANGEDASIDYMGITFGDASEEERKEVREALERYCKLDTEGMVWIVNKLKEGPADASQGRLNL